MQSDYGFIYSIIIFKYLKNTQIVRRGADNFLFFHKKVLVIAFIAEIYL